MATLPTHSSPTPTVLLVDRLSKSYIQIHGSFTHTPVSDSNYYPTWPYFLSLIYRYMVPLPTHPSLTPTILLVDRLSKSHNQIHGSCTHKPLSYLTQTILHEHPSTTPTIQHGQIVSVSYSDTWWKYPNTPSYSDYSTWQNYLSVIYRCRYMVT